MKTQRGLLFLLIIGGLLAIAILSEPITLSPNNSSRTLLSLAAAEPQDAVRDVEPNAPANDSSINALEMEQEAETTPTQSANTALLNTNPTPSPPAVSAEELAEIPSAPPQSPSAAQSLPTPVDGWNPPSLSVPLARHPNDHFWMIRPVALNYTNTGLDWYHYGSNGPNDDIRVHHGVDLANPVGVDVVAAGSGTVNMAGDGFSNEFEEITVYGNTIVIEHDVGYKGQSLYTLYAHLSAILVQPGQRIKEGQIIGLIGATGLVSGPHVHFEVRINENRYGAVRNPDLWLAPYAGTGVIAGHVRGRDGRTIYDADVALVDLATGRTTHRVTTYASSPSLNADDNWNENFVIPNVPVGQYLVTATTDTASWSGQVRVLEGMTNWVEMNAYTADNQAPASSPTP